MENENIKLRELAKEFFKNCITPTENDLYDFLAKKQWEIYANYDRNKNKENLLFELSEKEYDWKQIPENLINDMVEKFEDAYFDNDYRWVHIMHDVIFDFEDDLENYKIIKIEDDDRNEMPYDYTNHFDSGDED